MNSLELQNYNLEKTLLGGQSFVWELDADGYYYGVTRDMAIKLKLDRGFLYWQTYPSRDDEVFLRNYLRLDFDYEKMIKDINKDNYVSQAIERFPNLWLLNQDFEETLISYLFSSTKSIKSIRTSMNLFRRKFGKKIELNNKEIYLFPEIEVIANASIEDLLDCRIGFRAKNVKAAAQKLTNEKLGLRVSKLGFIEIKNELLKFQGIGNKIADCILVYSLKADHLTPLDIWGQRVLTRFYGLDRNMKYEEMSSWYSSCFGEYTAWAGQFLFEHIRE